jgi:glycerol-3-phosphate acyltransferase PlsX
MRIIVDGYGGDNAPLEIIKGSADAIAQCNGDLSITLCGNEQEMKKVMADNSISQNGFEFVNTTEVISQCEDPTSAIRIKKDSSMVVALNLLKNGKGDAMVSAGSTGALFTGATLIVKRIPGIKRAALAPLLPTKNTPVILIDCGANLEVKPEYLLQFGQMGACYMEYVMGVKNPRVGLINVGSEETKGTEIYKEAHTLLKNSTLNFIGNIEGRDISDGMADVAVCDGFIGNTVLKVTEGVGMFLIGSIKNMLLHDTKSKIAALLLKPQLKAFKKKIDWNETGGAIILGIDKPVIKAHGSCKSEAFKNALMQAKKYSDGNVVEIIRNSIANITDKNYK